MKEKTGIRLIATFKILKGVLFVGVSFGLFRLIHSNLEQVADNFLRHIRLDPDNEVIRHFLVQFINLSPATIHKFYLTALAYSILILTEGFGLWFEQQWAKYLVIISSGILLPIEMHEVLHHPTSLKWLILGANLLMVGYLCYLVMFANRKK